MQKRFCTSILLVTVADAAIFCDSAAFLCVLSHNTNSVLISCQSYITRRGTTTASFLFVHNNVNFCVYTYVWSLLHIILYLNVWHEAYWACKTLPTVVDSLRSSALFLFIFFKCLISIYPNLHIILVWYCIRKCFMRRNYPHIG